MYFKKISFLISCVLPLFLAGCKPIVTITAPANGDTFEVGETITFEGQATDQQHPDLADYAFVWKSAKDGEIGTGPSFESSDLSEGEHTITLTVTDPAGQSGQSSVTITVGNVTTSTTTSITITPTTTTTVAATGDRFQDNGNGTVTDTRTGLIWLKIANPCGAKFREDAGTYCASLANGQAGLTDGSTAGQWRLPSVRELEGIGTDPPTTYCLDGSCYMCPVHWTMPGAPFTIVQSSDFYFWSGPSAPPYTNSAWLVSMLDGNVYGSEQASYFGNYVWPVRGGN